MDRSVHQKTSLEEELEVAWKSQFSALDSLVSGFFSQFTHEQTYIEKLSKDMTSQNSKIHHFPTVSMYSKKKLNTSFISFKK